MEIRDGLIPGHTTVRNNEMIYNFKTYKISRWSLKSWEKNGSNSCNTLSVEMTKFAIIYIRIICEWLQRMCENWIIVAREHIRSIEKNNWNININVEHKQCIKYTIFWHLIYPLRLSWNYEKNQQKTHNQLLSEKESSSFCQNILTLRSILSEQHEISNNTDVHNT